MVLNMIYNAVGSRDEDGRATELASKVPIFSAMATRDLFYRERMAGARMTSPVLVYVGYEFRKKVENSCEELVV